MRGGHFGVSVGPEAARSNSPVTSVFSRVDFWVVVVFCFGAIAGLHRHLSAEPRWLRPPASPLTLISNDDSGAMATPQGRKTLLDRKAAKPQGRKAARPPSRNTQLTVLTDRQGGKSWPWKT